MLLIYIILNIQLFNGYRTSGYECKGINSIQSAADNGINPTV